jgi:hypothetical protein
MATKKQAPKNPKVTTPPMPATPGPTTTVPKTSPVVKPKPEPYVVPYRGDDDPDYV